MTILIILKMGEAMCNINDHHNCGSMIVYSYMCKEGKFIFYFLSMCAIVIRSVEVCTMYETLIVK
jgi:hypothetical protein